MNTTVASPQLWERWGQRERLVLLAAFDDSAACARAKEFCQDLSRRLGGSCQVIQHVWVFSTLRMRELREIAAEEASMSDLVVISAHHAASLPEEVKEWIEIWLRQRGAQPAVLLALLDSGYEGHASPIRVYLQEIAQRAGLEFLVDTPGGF